MLKAKDKPQWTISHYLLVPNSRLRLSRAPCQIPCATPAFWLLVWLIP